MVGFSQVAANEHIPRSRCRAVSCKLQTIYAFWRPVVNRDSLRGVSAPSYWNIQEKIGLSMAAVHQPVTTLETKIGEQIRRFARHSPVMTPFERSNWFVWHRERLHLSQRLQSPLNPTNGLCAVNEKPSVALPKNSCCSRSMSDPPRCVIFHGIPRLLLICKLL